MGPFQTYCIDRGVSQLPIALLLIAVAGGVLLNFNFISTFACLLMPTTGRSALLPLGVAAGPRNRHPVRKLDDGEFIHSF